MMALLSGGTSFFSAIGEHALRKYYIRAYVVAGGLTWRGKK